jgi:hypothetical protein
MSTFGSTEMEVSSAMSFEVVSKETSLLWILISYLSQVSVPSPQGVFLVEILKILVGYLTGPLTFNPFFLISLTKSLETKKLNVSFETFFEVFNVTACQ